MRRRQDWASQMARVVLAHRRVPHVWGQTDCCRFAARVVDAMTGSGLELQLRELYDDEASAQALIRFHGSLERAVTALLRQDPLGVRARRGDLVLIEGGDAVGICDGQYVLAMGPDGIRDQVPRTEILRVWPIGR